jgi:hypothetical protein
MISATAILFWVLCAGAAIKIVVELQIEKDAADRDRGWYTSAEWRAIKRQKRQEAKAEKLRKRIAKYDQIVHRERIVRCNVPSPDGILLCRLESGHPGWHTHHGPISWYFERWAEDEYAELRGPIPW